MLRIHRRMGFSMILCLSFVASAAIGLHAQTKRALLIGIDQYVPPGGTARPVPATGHAADSRFAPNSSWINLHGPSVDLASVRQLLQDKYGFTDIRVLSDEQATRQGMLDAIDKLTTDTQRGDLVVFYYAGHGSLRLDTKSSKNHLDETIVPADAWNGAEDIRDKELAFRFNKIVYEKQARLRAIYDSCHSGTMARGITNSVQRTLPYDDRDVAQEAGAITEADLKQIPQNGDAIIIAAAASTESAVEARYPDDDEYHGAFTRALVRVLQSSTQPMSAEELVAAVSSMLHADQVPFQQPSVEGRVQESLFGEPVAAHALRVRVAKITGAKISLDVGSAAGFDVGTQFTAIDAGDNGQKIMLEVTNVDGPMTATANVTSGEAKPQIGQIFELSKMVYPQTARLTVFLPKTESIADAGAIQKIKSLFPGISWVDDPTSAPINFLVTDGPKGWVAVGQKGGSLAPGAAAKGVGFLLLGPTAPLVDRVQRSEPFQRGAFRFTQDLAEANYILTMRLRADGISEYALFDPQVLAPHAAGAYVRSTENDTQETDLNQGVAPEVVCRNDVSLPVRTAWLHATGAGDSLAPTIVRRIVRLGKLRVWLQVAAFAPGASNWPYHLAVIKTGSNVGFGNNPLHLNDQYDVRLTATSQQMAAQVPIPKHVYLFGFDCAANPFLLYPAENMNGEATFPQPGENGVYPTSFTLTQESVGTPLGADTLFFMATKEKIIDTSLLLNDGVIERGARGATNRFDELISDMGDAGVRGPQSVPRDWLLQQFVVPSKP